MKNCRRCGQLKGLEAFSKASKNADGRSHTCKPCVVERNREYWRTPLGRMSYIYAGQQVASRERGHPAPQYSREELTAWALSQGLEQLTLKWAASGYPKDLAPSVDRLDDFKGYSLDNIQLVCWKDNNEKMYAHRKEGKRITRQNKRIEQLSLDGRHIAFHPSIAFAARATGAVRTNINAMCAGKPHLKSVGGFIWRYA